MKLPNFGSFVDTVGIDFFLVVEFVVYVSAVAVVVADTFDNRDNDVFQLVLSILERLILAVMVIVDVDFWPLLFYGKRHICKNIVKVS